MTNIKDEDGAIKTADKIQSLPDGDIVVESAWSYSKPNYIRVGIHTDDLKTLVSQLSEERDKGREWRLALEGLTAQGSEFHNDIHRCVDYVRRRYADGHEALKNGVRLKRELESERDKVRRLTKALERLGMIDANLDEDVTVLWARVNYMSDFARQTLAASALSTTEEKP